MTAVVRLDGSRPATDLSLAPVLARLDAWRAAGVDVAGVEIDHDCATAALPAYAAWLTRVRPPAPLRWSITALPTWAGAPALRDVAAAVDELVVQVHAIRAPRLFDAATARRWLDAVAAAVPGATLRVALPTYRVAIDGEVAAAAPAEVAGLLRDLERAPVPGLRGVVWFRLPVDGDAAAWSAPTLRAVIRGDGLTSAVTARLVARARGVYDVVLANPGTVDAPWPDLRVTGAVAAMDLIGGYAAPASSARVWTAPRKVVRAGDHVVVGWATGEDLEIDANP
ncbi:MAG: DUF3142 domain-containing protein [Kofleriaceae bacterium]|nr:DUF3142 domain-containing protein [Kofleriaceae bacterium]